MSARETIRPLPSATPQPVAMPTTIPTVRRARPGLITDWHLGLLAIVYVRQSISSADPSITENRANASTRWSTYAVALGWPRDRILIIDDDQGLSGKTAENRSGFHRILAEVTMEHVGLILGIEMSRLARCNEDWHHLIADVFCLRNDLGG